MNKIAFEQSEEGKLNAANNTEFPYALSCLVGVWMGVIVAGWLFYHAVQFGISVLVSILR